MDEPTVSRLDSCSSYFEETDRTCVPEKQNCVFTVHGEIQRDVLVGFTMLQAAQTQFRSPPLYLDRDGNTTKLSVWLNCIRQTAIEEKKKSKNLYASSSLPFMVNKTLVKPEFPECSPNTSSCNEFLSNSFTIFLPHPHASIHHYHLPSTRQICFPCPSQL